VDAVGAEIIRSSGTPIYCIGPVTAQTAREFGLEPAAVAEEHTLEGIVEAVIGGR
jgi:uroporphyrinogen-III synthase